MNQKKNKPSEIAAFKKSDYRILVVEDSKAVNMLVYDGLRAEGYTCSQAFTFKEAREQVASSTFNLIIMDLHLPDGEGEELIFGFNKLGDTKIIILTSDDDKMLRNHLYQLGILEYFVKNEQILHTIAVIDKLIEKIELNRTNTILVIDDSPTVHRLLKIILEPRNYTLCFASTGTEALALFKEKAGEIDLVLLDLELPDMHGLKILKKIKNDQKNILLPILAVSGTTNPNMVSSTLKSGAFDFIKKPFITEEFVLKVDMWIDYNRKGREIESYQNRLEQRVADEMHKRRKQEMMLMQQSRLAGMGEMIANIAHQWRQPLNTLSLLHVQLKTAYSFGQLNETLMDDSIERANVLIQKMSSTIDDFSNFFQSDKEEERFSLAEVVRETLGLVDALLKHNNIKVVENYGDDLFVRGFKNEFSQVVINILTNAKDALVQQGTDSPTITIDCYIKEGYACLSIADNAGGISEAEIEKIFDPYYTTKEMGTGIGLYMSKIIITEHMRGKIRAKNSQDGAVFTVKIPLNGRKSAGL